MMNIVDRKNYFESLERGRGGYHDDYYAMYSSRLGGITKDPLLMQVPVDDHLVHRGDGVFETFKCVNGALYNLGAHLDRFENSARLLDFDMPWSMSEVRELVLATAKEAGKESSSVRLMLSRGPGSFSVNPYDCVGSQLYIIVSKLKKSFMQLHPEGATLGVSKVSAKLSFFARVKNCNYLPNVLMMKESVDMGVDFVVGFDSAGMLTEGATENVGILTADGELAFPVLDGILCGTTMLRVADLAREHASELGISGVSFRNIPRSELSTAKEIMVVGTTPDVTFVREFDGKAIPVDISGSTAFSLNSLLVADIENNADLRTEI